VEDQTFSQFFGFECYTTDGNWSGQNDNLGHENRSHPATTAIIARWIRSRIFTILPTSPSSTDLTSLNSSIRRCYARNAQVSFHESMRQQYFISHPEDRMEGGRALRIFCHRQRTEWRLICGSLVLSLHVLLLLYPNQLADVMTIFKVISTVNSFSSFGSVNHRGTESKVMLLRNKNHQPTTLITTTPKFEASDSDCWMPTTNFAISQNKTVQFVGSSILSSPKSRIFQDVKW